MIKVGLGYDIHRFGDKRTLFLGGVEIPYEKGLVGHSDADVLLHAVCDAILGALGQGDIGEHFPNTDEAFKDISSLKLLNAVQKVMEQQGYAVGNMDAVVIAEEPNIKKYKPQMKQTIASQLKINASAVNIKATTQEGLGSLGDKQGIAAYATVLLIKAGENQ